MLMHMKKTNAKKTIKEEEKTHRDFERNLNKLALFAYEAEQGIKMLEDGQNPFLEEVDQLLQQMNRPNPFLAESRSTISIEEMVE